MRHLIIALIIVILVLSIGIFEQIFVRDTLDNMREMTCSIIDSLQDNDLESARTQSNTLRAYYDDNKNTLELLFNHNEFREIPAFIGEMIGYLKIGKGDEAIVRAEVILSDIEGHLSNTRFCIQNII